MRFGLASLLLFSIFNALAASAAFGQGVPARVSPIYSVEVPGFPGSDGHDSVAVCGSDVFYVNHSLQRIRQLRQDQIGEWVDSEFAPQGSGGGFSVLRLYGQGNLLAAVYATAYSSHRIDLFERDSVGNWSLEQSIASPQGASFVWVYQIQWSGSDLLVVDRYADSFRGAAFIFKRNAAGAWQQAAKLQGSGSHPFYTEVWSAGFDGGRAILGHWLEDCGYQAVSGTAYVFEADTQGNWSETAALRPSTAQCGDVYGSNVTIRGASAFVSSYFPNRIYHFRNETAGWTQVSDLPLPALSGNPIQGTRMQATEWGILSRASDSRLIAYAEYEGAYAPIAVLSPSSPPPGDCYCWNIACDGTRVATMSGLSSGQAAVSIFELSSTLDCNHDGLVDYGQIVNGQLADANSNSTPDICEAGFIRGTPGNQEPSGGLPIRDFDMAEGLSVGIQPNGELAAWGSYCTVLPAGPFKSVSAGRNCGIALRPDGSAVAFGQNDFGRLDVPTGQYKVVSAADATWHAGAVRLDGTVVCWGFNNAGQCNAPSGTFTAISAGGHEVWSGFTLAIRADTTLAAWGSDGWGQSSVPTGTGYRKVAAGYYHAAALRWDNSIAAWGANNNGQASAPAGAFVDVACGTATIALRADGTVLVIGTVDPQSNALFAGLSDCTKAQAICCDGATVLRRIDCDRNAVFDAIEVLANPSIDLNQNGSLDACECPIDSDGDSILDCVDGCPNDSSKAAPGVCGCGVTDQDSDGDGTADCIDGCPTDPSKTSPGICGCGVSDADSDGDGAADCVDGCPTDPGKIAPGVCGCGSPDLDADSDGRTDCRDVNLHLSVTAIDLHPGGIVEMRVEAQTLQPVVEIIGLQAALTFDASRLRVLGVSPAADSPLSTELSEVIDQTAGTIRYALGAMPPASGMTLGAAMFDITLQFHASADLCTTIELARLATVNGFGSLLAARDGSTVQPSVSWSTVRQLDVTAPQIVGLPAPTTVPHDAGNTAGATLDEWLYWPSISDPCGFTYERLVQLPDGSWNQWYWPSSFPTGTSTVLWRATDNLGNSSEASTTITVDPHQLLDAKVTLVGAVDPTLPPFNRSIRVEVGATAVVQSLAFTPGGVDGMKRTANLTGMQLPVQAGSPCARAKDVGFSLTDAVTTAIVDARYKAEFALRQGDSNGDDAVDIIDYGIWYIDFGPAGMTDRSNFNADGFVNNADFAWLGLNIFQRGETCGGLLPGDEPLWKISVKELRRRGLGELAGADLNRDGWLDMRDVAIALGSANPPESAAPDPDARVE